MNDISKQEISDKEAVTLLNETKYRRAQPATVFVKRTVVYPVDVYYKVGTPTREIRSFVRQHEYCSPSQWERALEYEAKYPGLQKEYRSKLKAMGIPDEVREPANILRASLISMG